MAEVSKYVTLISNDGFEFVVLREAVLISPMIKSMIDSKMMEKVVEYFHYWYKNREKEDVPDMDIPAELCLELLVAADFLGLDSKKPLQQPHGGY
ncbi:Skp1 family protein [Apiospora hydei]|uniref:Elongin-C n=1 Tax=Apiospora hydei TaxID=1337664 RepID=A0ABR1XE90_9PEZI